MEVGYAGDVRKCQGGVVLGLLVGGEESTEEELGELDFLQEVLVGGVPGNVGEESASLMFGVKEVGFGRYLFGELFILALLENHEHVIEDLQILEVTMALKDF